MFKYDKEFDEVSEENLPIADVIASGYEYICPYCEEFHEVPGYPKQSVVSCQECGEEFGLNIPEHAYD
jgi:uncharacterized protein (DUF983 family)